MMERREEWSGEERERGEERLERRQVREFK